MGTMWYEPERGEQRVTNIFTVFILLHHFMNHTERRQENYLNEEIKIMTHKVFRANRWKKHKRVT